MGKKDLLLGYAWNPETGRVGEPVSISPPHLVVIGSARIGKDSAYAVPATLRRKLSAAARAEMRLQDRKDG